MGQTEQVRELATSILAQATNAEAAKNAAELLRLAAEIEKLTAEARKLEREEQKTKVDLADAERRQKSENRKAYITLLAPVFTTLILAATLATQSIQFKRTEQDKATEAQRQTDAAEDVRWENAVKLVSDTEKISPAGALLKSFANSKRYASRAYDTALQILLKTNDPPKFQNLFSSVFDPVNWDNFNHVVDLDRTLESQKHSLYNKTWDSRKHSGDTRKLNTSDQQNYKNIDTNLDWVSDRLATTIKGFRPIGSTLDLRAAYLSSCDLGGANLSGANLSGTSFVYVDLTGANLEGIAEYQDSSWFGTAWWHASQISKSLLEYLVSTYPLDISDINGYKSRDPITRSHYEAEVARLRAKARTP